MAQANIKSSQPFKIIIFSDLSKEVFYYKWNLILRYNS